MKIGSLILALIAYLLKKYFTVPKINRQIRELQEKVDVLTSEKVATPASDRVRFNQLNFDIKLLNRRIRRLNRQLRDK